MKRYGLILLGVFCIPTAISQTTLIPDSNFEQALVDLNIDSDGLVNGSILNYDAAQIQILDISSKLISDLTGIEAFSNLENLICGFNLLTTLDLSQLPLLEQLSCHNNQLTSLDLSGNPALFFLDCSNNQISSLNLNQNINLNSIWCGYNQLTTLNLSPVASLVGLACDHNQLTFLNLDFNDQLIQFICNDNQLQALSLKNGNNINFSGPFTVLNNPELTCIEVDNAAWSTANWTSIDSQSSFSEFCPLDLNSAIMEEIVLYPNPVSDFVTIQGVSEGSFEVYSANGLLIQAGLINSDFTGLNLAYYEPGQYFIRIINDNFSETKSIIKI